MKWVFCCTRCYSWLADSLVGWSDGRLVAELLLYTAHSDGDRVMVGSQLHTTSALACQKASSTYRVISPTR